MRSKLQNNPRMPPAKKGESLHVFTGIYIESISNFQAAQMFLKRRFKFTSNDQSFDVDLYLYSNWKDASLNHSSINHVMINDPRVREKIW